MTIAEIPADALELIEAVPPKAIVENAKDKSNREELVKIVDYLNSNGQKREPNEDNTLTNADAITGQVEDEIKIAQKNDDANITAAKNKDDNAVSQVRLHVIKNPEILKEYVQGLRKRDTSSSSSSDDSSSDHDDSSLDGRRNAEFRVDKGASNEISDDKNMKVYSDADTGVKKTRSIQSMEDQVTPFRADKDHRERKRGEMKIQSRDTDGDRDGHRPKQYNKADKPADNWDMMTVTENLSEKSEKKHDIEWENADGTEKSQRLLWGVYKNFNTERSESKENAKTTDERKENGWDKQRNIDDGPKKFKKRKWIAEKGKQHKNSWEDDVNWKIRSDSINDDVEKKVAKKSSNKKWNDRTTKKKRVANDWNVTPDLDKIAEAESWKKVGMNWEHKKSKDTRNRDKPRKTTRYNWQRNENKKPAITSDKARHIARIPDLELSNSKNGLPGRTPIPFVGKKGIYADQ